MAKNKFGLGKFVAFATIAGAVAAGISYFTKYKSFSKELEEDFHDFEDNGSEVEDTEEVDSTMSRNYVTLNSVKNAAEEITETVKEAAADTGEELSDTAEKITDVIEDAAKDVTEEITDAAKDTASAATTIVEDIIE